MIQHCSRCLMPSSRPRVSRFDRFWSKVQIGLFNECWPWKAYKLSNGYGRFGWKKGDIRLAHRAAFELWHGFIDDRFVCHRCDNPGCVNPHHLFQASHVENMRDMKAKGRSLVGSRNANAKLTEEKVRQMRSLKTETGLAYIKIGVLYGVSEMTAWHAINGKSWKHA